tara:strand:+ start:130 stop:2472 length:2343 start_codon:yes stop_codon:yes gene_type:complete
MKLDKLWAELKRRRVVRVVIAYAAVVYVVLEVAQLTFEPLGLPDWTYQFLIFIVLAGFPVAGVLAWAFDVTPDDGGKETDARPGRRGRWILVSAIVIALGVAIWQFSFRPNTVMADGVNSDLIAVIPFRISSADERVTILREGVIDMLAPIFSATPRVVDSGQMVSAWRNYIEDESQDLSEGEAVELARRLGAGRVLVGSIVGDGDAFALNARLLQVPGGGVIGDVIVDGSAEGLREVLSQLASQVLSMEAGVEDAQIDYLANLPLEALREYLKGRSASRRNAYRQAQTAFARALDIDSTFALAAIGAQEAVSMGADADSYALGNRANRLLGRYLDNLPPRDRDYFVQLRSSSGGRESVVEHSRRLAELANRFSDRADAWYRYGDYLYHSAWRVGDEEDWVERAKEAFNRAASLDPSLGIVQQHLVFLKMTTGDTVGLRDMLEQEIGRFEATEWSVFSRGAMAGILGDSVQLAWMNENIARLSYAEAITLGAGEGFLTVQRYPSPYTDRIFARLERSALSEADRLQYIQQWHNYLRSAGRSSEADDALRTIEITYGPRPEEWVRAFLYWDGLEEPARLAADQLIESVGSEGPLVWSDNARQACYLELWRLRQGDLSQTTSIVERLRAGADDPNPAHGRNALCALTLEVILADKTGSPEARELIQRLVGVHDEGPSRPLAIVAWSGLELAWILEERGEVEAGARVVRYNSTPRVNPFSFAMSSVNREAGRLNDLAGDYARALQFYRSFVLARGSADSRLSDEVESIVSRITELEAELDQRR